MWEDEEDYGLEYSEDSKLELYVDFQNQYYISKGETPHALKSLQKFKIDIQLTKLNVDRNGFGKLQKTLKQLHQSCQTDDEEEDLKLRTQLLKIDALEIHMYSMQKNNKKLKALYEQSLHIRSANPHPMIMGVSWECGGKMYLQKREIENAHTDLLEMFEKCDESGLSRRTIGLKKLVLANM